MFESGLAKAAGAEVLVQQRTEKWHAAAAQRTSSETASGAFAGVGKWPLLFCALRWVFMWDKGESPGSPEAVFVAGALFGGVICFARCTRCFIWNHHRRHFHRRCQTWCGQQTTPEVPRVVLGGSADAPRLAMEQTKMSHASRFGRRCSIWRGFSDDSSCSGSVLDFSFKETMRHQSHFFVAATLFGGDGWWPLLPRPMHMYTGRFVCCDSDAAMRIKSWYVTWTPW